MKQLTLLFVLSLFLGACNQTVSVDSSNTPNIMESSQSPDMDTSAPATQDYPATPEESDTSDLFGAEADIEAGL
jgi:hypothetical protein